MLKYLSLALVLLLGSQPTPSVKINTFQYNATSVGVVLSWNNVRDAGGNPIILYLAQVRSTKTNVILVHDSTAGLADTLLVPLVLGDTVTVYGAVAARDSHNKTGSYGVSVSLHLENWTAPPAPTVNIDTLVMDSTWVYKFGEVPIVRSPRVDIKIYPDSLGNVIRRDSVQLCAIVFSGPTKYDTCGTYGSYIHVKDFRKMFLKRVA